MSSNRIMTVSRAISEGFESVGILWRSCSKVSIVFREIVRVSQYAVKVSFGCNPHLKQNFHPSNMRVVPLICNRVRRIFLSHD